MSELFYRDFDAAFAEARKEGPRLHLYGEEHQLPESLPVAFYLAYERTQKQGKSAKADASVFELFQALFGADRYTAWLGKGLTMGEMVGLLKWTMEAYGAAAKQAQDGDVERITAARAASEKGAPRGKSRQSPAK